MLLDDAEDEAEEEPGEEEAGEEVVNPTADAIETAGVLGTAVTAGDHKPSGPYEPPE